MAINLHSAVDGFKIDNALLIFAERVAQRLGIPSDSSVNIIFVGDDKMIELNREYFACDHTTDCIAFNIDQEPPPVGEWIFGEVYLGWELAKRQGKEVGWGMLKELALLLVHGLLHLVGFRDKNHREREMMMSEAMKLLQELWEG